MDEQTRAYYSEFAAEIVERYDAVEPQMYERLRRTFYPGQRVLDIGAGSGRDVRLLLSLGCDAYGLEPCEQLREAACRQHPELVGRLAAVELPEIGQPFGGSFDGVLCSAVLMHLPKAEMLNAAIAIRNVLKENGRLLLSIPLERPGIDADHRDRNGRLFTLLTPDYLQLLYERIGFHLLERWDTDDSLGREQHTWCTFLFQAKHQGGLRPLDQIEGILNRDRKTATYKLALFRALSEIATTEFERVRWAQDGVVGIPVDAVAQKWLHYYWPLIESSAFIPQIRGESPTSRKPIAFRSALSALVEKYHAAGGLTRFVLDYRGGILAPDVAALTARVLTQIQNTVVAGPVTYAGGSLESGPVFKYESRLREIQMSAAIWRELSLVGHWIQDAVVLRWAELTSDISKKAIKPSEVVDLLLTVPIPERDVADARATYMSLGAIECTWTGVPLGRSFDVDHIVPFSLWHNNDLWNLVPATPKANNAKSDKLPTRELLFKRRECITGYWEALHSAYPIRFSYEAQRIAGQKNLTANWQTVVFHTVCDAVEFTASQRGSNRWQP